MRIIFIVLVIMFTSFTLWAAEMKESKEPVTLVEVLEGHRDALKYILKELDTSNEAIAELQELFTKLDIILGQYMRHNEARQEQFKEALTLLQAQVRALLNKEQAAILQGLERTGSL